jgi:arylformamidase
MQEESMRKSIVAAVIVMLACSGVVSTSHAGPIRDMLKQRAEQRRDAARPAHDDDELGDGAGGPSAQSLPAGVSVERDIAYGSDAAQRLDVYRPAKPDPNGLVILMVHGGGWARGDKTHGRTVTNKVAHWVPQGHVFVSTNYRMVPAADPVQQADDVARALAFVQARAVSWGMNPARVVLMGHSAGSHLVSLVSADPSIATRQGARPWLGTVALDGAGYDVVTIMEGRHFRLYDKAFGTDRALWTQGSPTRRLNAAPPPMLLVCSSRRDDSCAQAQGFLVKANAMGGKVERRMEDKSHGEINEQLGLRGPYTEAVDAFLRRLSADSAPSSK